MGVEAAEVADGEELVLEQGLAGMKDANDTCRHSDRCFEEFIYSNGRKRVETLVQQAMQQTELKPRGKCRPNK